MKNVIAVIVCLCTVLFVLIYRNVVYDQPADAFPVDVTTGDESGAGTALQLHFHERRPYYVRYKNDVFGFVAGPVAKALREAEIDFEWIEIPAGRQLEMIRANTTAMCALGWFKTPERELFAQFTHPVYLDKAFVIVTRADVPLVESHDLLNRIFAERRLKLLVKSGYSYGDSIDPAMAEYNPWSLTTTADNIGMLEMILDNRADYSFMTEEEIYDLLVHSSLNRADFKVVHLDDSSAGYLRYLICSKKVKKSTMARMNDAIDHFLKISVDR